MDIGKIERIVEVERIEDPTRIPQRNPETAPELVPSGIEVGSL